MRLNIVVGSSDYAYKYSGFRRKQEYFEEKDPNGVNTNTNNNNPIKEGGKPGVGGNRRRQEGEGVNNYKEGGKYGGRRGGRQSGYNDRNKKSGEDKKEEKEDNVPPVVTRAPKITGYIPGAELEEDIPTSNQPNKNDTHVTVNPGIENSNPSNKESPKQEIIEVQDIPTETIIMPVEEDKNLIPSPNFQNNNLKQSLKQETISPNNKEKLLAEPHENGSQKTSTQIEPQSYTFNLSTPLGPELTTGEQTFMEINGSLYLKISPNTTPLPSWYTSLQDDFQYAKNPKSKNQKHQKGKNMKKNYEAQPEVKNGKMIFPIRVPDILQDKKLPQNTTNVEKKKNNN